MLAFAVQRIRELARSRSNEAATGGVRASPRSFPLMVAAHAGLLTLPMLEVSLRRTAPPASWPWLALLGGATAIRIWSIRSLGQAWNVHASVPAQLQPVVTGPYALIRHLNYLAVILEFAALPLVAGAWMSALGLSALNAVVLFDRIRSEERLLESSAAYREAFAERARFLPGVF